MNARTFGNCGHCGGPRDWAGGQESSRKIVCPRCDPFLSSLSMSSRAVIDAFERVRNALDHMQQRSWNKGTGYPNATAEGLAVALLSAARELELHAASLVLLAERLADEEQGERLGTEAAPS